MYIIQEIQTTKGVTTLLPAETRMDRNEADSVFYMKISYAASSAIDVHTIIMFDEHGNIIEQKFYEHHNDSLENI